MGLFGFFKKGKGSEETRARVQALIEQLGDSSWEVRLAACEALQALGEAAAEAGPKLQELIEDENGDVCLAAAAAMSEIERGL